jgi:hypothetical protein
MIYAVDLPEDLIQQAAKKSGKRSPKSILLFALKSLVESPTPHPVRPTARQLGMTLEQMCATLDPQTYDRDELIYGSVGQEI